MFASAFPKIRWEREAQVEVGCEHPSLKMANCFGALPIAISRLMLDARTSRTTTEDLEGILRILAMIDTAIIPTHVLAEGVLLKRLSRERRLRLVNGIIASKLRDRYHHMAVVNTRARMPIGEGVLESNQTGDAQVSFAVYRFNKRKGTKQSVAMVHVIGDGVTNEADPQADVRTAEWLQNNAPNIIVPVLEKATNNYEVDPPPDIAARALFAIHQELVAYNKRNQQNLRCTAAVMIDVGGQAFLGKVGDASLQIMTQLGDGAIQTRSSHPGNNQFWDQQMVATSVANAMNTTWSSTTNACFQEAAALAISALTTTDPNESKFNRSDGRGVGVLGHMSGEVAPYVEWDRVYRPTKGVRQTIHLASDGLEEMAHLLLTEPWIIAQIMATWGLTYNGDSNLQEGILANGLFQPTMDLVKLFATLLANELFPPSLDPTHPFLKISIIDLEKLSKLSFLANPLIVFSVLTYFFRTTFPQALTAQLRRKIDDFVLISVHFGSPPVLPTQADPNAELIDSITSASAYLSSAKGVHQAAFTRAFVGLTH